MKSYQSDLGPSAAQRPEFQSVVPSYSRFISCAEAGVPVSCTIILSSAEQRPEFQVSCTILGLSAAQRPEFQSIVLYCTRFISSADRPQFQSVVLP